MKRLLPAFLSVLILGAAPARAVDGLIELKSARPAKETMDRFEAIAKERGLTIFARVDHAAGAAAVGMTLRPTEVLVFGNARGGTPLMECAQTAGIDLPLKALVWQDAMGQVWLGYNDPAYVARRHAAETCPGVEAMSKALDALAKAAVAS